MAFIHKASGFRGTVFCLLFFMVFSFICQAYINHASASEYKIEDVDVDVTAENAVQAREKAFEEAQIKAFQLLAERLLKAEELENFIMPEIDIISGYVQDFEVSNEQLSSVRYKGSYTFRFRPDAIHHHMQETQTPFSVEASTENTSVSLILPYIQEYGRSRIWDENNAFMTAFKGLAVADPNIANHIVVPLGDVLDIQRVQDNSALVYSWDQMNRMLVRYDAQQAIIAIAEQRQNHALDVSLYKVDRSVPDFMTSFQIPASTAYMQHRGYEQAAQKTVEYLMQSVKQTAEIDPTQSNSLKARVAFSGIQEWLAFKRKLENVPQVQVIKVQGLKPKEAVIKIDFLGEETQFLQMLVQSGVGIGLPDGYQNAYNAGMPGKKIYDLHLKPSSSMSGRL